MDDEIILAELRKYLNVDFGLLEYESRDQSTWMLDFSEELANTSRLRKIKALDLKKTVANKKKAIFNDWESYFSRFPTDAMVNSHVDTDNAIYNLRKELIEIETKEQRLEGRIQSLVQRKYTIKDLIHLYENNYWAKPRVNEDALKAISERESVMAQSRMLNEDEKRESKPQLIKRRTD